jgi:voltage-gated potassium channel
MGFFQNLKKKLGWKAIRPKPEFNLDPEIYSKFKPFRLPLVLVQFVMIIGTMGYVFIDNFKILDAIYQTGITFTTVGFGEIAPISNAGRVFTITLIIFGFAVFTLSTAILIDAVVNGDLLKLLKERRMLFKIARLRNHFVIFHHNEYSAQLAVQFRKTHIPFVVVDPREDIEEIAKKNNYPYFVQEETFTERAFLKSHLSSAKGVISLSKSISDNITLIASIRLYEKELRRNPFLVICNAENTKDEERLKKLGADKVVTPPNLMAKRVSAMAARPEMENVLEEFLYDKDTPLDMEEIVIKTGSWTVGHKLKETHLRDKFSVSVIGITKNNGRFVQMPDGEKILEEGFKLLVVGSSRSILKARKMIRKKEKPEILLQYDKE